jgi:hypothetical protein
MGIHDSKNQRKTAQDLSPPVSQEFTGNRFGRRYKIYLKKTLKFLQCYPIKVLTAD